MSKYAKIQTRKVIGSYGGIGSIIETPQGSLIIENFDQWLFVTQNIYKEEQYEIIDKRLLNRLMNKNGFPKLKVFFKIPDTIESFKNPNFPQDRKKVIKGRYFPEWFYCDKCNRLNKIDEWWKLWKITLERYNVSQNTIRESFYGDPKCSFCFDEAKKKNLKRKYYALVQVRFILISSCGNIKDIPWDEWPSCSKSEKDSETNTNVAINLNGKCCDNPELIYKKSNTFSDLSGVSIICNSCHKRNTLSGLFGLKLPDYKDKENKSFFKPMIRSSNSVYYPIIISSLFIPIQQKINFEDRNRIKSFKADKESLDFIYRALEKKYTKEEIQSFINGEDADSFESENEYRLKEYEYFLSKNYEMSDNLIFSSESLDQLLNYGISNVKKIKRVKITSVQTSYTRQEPLDKDIFLGNEEINTKIKPKYTSKWGKNAEYLPAIENYGEGIFINFSSEILTNWVDKILTNDKAKDRINTIYNNYKENEFFPKEKFGNINHLCRFVLMHTFSHLIIKELEFLCGYSSASINERLYVDSENMAGVFIYTVAGLEGSYGGLVRYSNENKLVNIINSALYRASDCTSDPVCYNTIGGQGISGLNMAACYSCTLLPETSCEEFNCFLDRALLIDSKFGYFREIKQSIS